MSILQGVQVFIYGVALWFGVYLLSRRSAQSGLRFAGLGLVAYALGLGFDLLLQFEDITGLGDEIESGWYLFTMLPAIFWVFATLRLVDGEALSQPAAFVFPLAGAGALSVGLWLTGWMDFWDGLRVIPFTLALYAVYLAARAMQTRLPPRSRVILFTAALFFFLGVGFLVLPLELIGGELIVLGISFDLLLLGYAIAALDAYDAGENLTGDFLRVFGISVLLALFLSVQVGMAAAIQGEMTLALMVLWLSMLFSAVLIPVVITPLQGWFDRLLFAHRLQMQTESADLRAIITALPRVDEALDVTALSDEEFARLTRRALSHLADLGHLAASPLSRLPVIMARLQAQNRPLTTLERAAELKALLIETIERLKPAGENGFGISPEWRHYNVLYFPYVRGLKPYARRLPQIHLTAAEKAALEWFSAEVPERTLYNWQTAAAKLVATTLRETSLD